MSGSESSKTMTTINVWRSKVHAFVPLPPHNRKCTLLKPLQALYRAFDCIVRFTEHVSIVICPTSENYNRLQTPSVPLPFYPFKFCSFGLGNSLSKCSCKTGLLSSAFTLSSNFESSFFCPQEKRYSVSHSRPMLFAVLSLGNSRGGLSGKRAETSFQLLLLSQLRHDLVLELCCR